MLGKQQSLVAEGKNCHCCDVRSLGKGQTGTEADGEQISFFLQPVGKARGPQAQAQRHSIEHGRVVWRQEKKIVKYQNFVWYIKNISETHKIF